MSTPSLSSLTSIKWKDGEEEHTFKLIQRISSKWFTIGIHLGETIDALENYKQKSNDNEVHLEYVFN